MSLNTRSYKEFDINGAVASAHLLQETILDVTQRLSISTKGIIPEKITCVDRKLPFFEKKIKNKSTLSFFATLDMLERETLDLLLHYQGGAVEVSAHISPQAQKEAAQLATIHQNKNSWLRNNVCCPECRSHLIFGNNGASCANGHKYDQPFHCMNMISPEISEENNLVGGEFVSRHHMSEASKKILASAKQKSGYVLDVGAGLKYSKDYIDNVINLEIEAYPTTDIMAAGQKLPFPDNTFDGLLCFAVLEHVSDPFACAREMARVLKPGGELCVGAPFIFEEHGFPEHYYNMTRRGLANLFENNLEVTRQTPGNVFLPMMIKSYISQLPPEAAKKLRGLTLGEIADADLKTALNMAGMHELSNDLRFRFALGTYIWAVKK